MMENLIKIKKMTKTMEKMIKIKKMENSKSELVISMFVDVLMTG